MGKPDLIPCDINVVIEKALSRYHSYRPRGIEIQTKFQPGLPLISGDPVQLAEAFDNLLSNAVEAMENGGTLAASANLASKLQKEERGVPEQGEEYLRIDIKDTGRGIEPQDVEKIFEPGFSQSKSGTGIGLAIVKEVVMKHKGRITLISEPGEGSTFTVFLPITKSEA